jgi:hypothetical protein
MRSILLLLSLLTLGSPITAQQTDSLLVARPLDQLERLQQRARVINQLAKEEKAAYQRCIEIHLDSRSQNKQLDVFFYHHARSKKGRDMAETLRNASFSNRTARPWPTGWLKASSTTTRKGSNRTLINPGIFAFL